MNEIRHIETAAEAKALGLENWIGTMGSKMRCQQVAVKTLRQAQGWCKRMQASWPSRDAAWVTFPMVDYAGNQIGFGAGSCPISKLPALK